MELVDLLRKVYANPFESTYLFDIDQTVRILKGLTINVSEIMHLLGEKGTVTSRYHTSISKENKYVIRFANGQEETFDESELDQRFIKRKQKEE